jgi:CNT family concentrative nucleoside transporter
VVWQSVLGIVVLTGLAWAMGETRRLDAWWTAAAGLAVQVVLTVVLLKVAALKQVFLWLNAAVLAVQEASRAGTGFVFGYLGGASLPFAESYPGASFVLAFQALPLILVMSALSALLFHWRVLPVVVRGFAWVLERSLGVGGAVGVGAAANVFVGMVEAPLMVRPYLRQLSRSELFMIMTCGMATIAGTVLVLYATFLANVVPDAVGHILTASLISAPAAIMVARLMVPGDGSVTEGAQTLALDDADGAMDAVTRGTTAGVGLLINVIAMLIVLVALVSLLNQVLGAFPDVAGAPLSLQRVLGWVMAPVVWLIGVPWGEAATAGALMGTKTVLNELLAYIELSRLPADALSERSRLIMTYALCGFANFGSLGIMIGGLGFKSIVSGTVATCLTGAMVGVLA